MPSILIVDDHSIVRKGLIFHCRVEFGFPDVEEADSCAALMAALRRKNYTHLILDLALSDGTTLEILPNIRKLYPSLNILIFSMAKFVLYEAALASYGIRRFISKDAPEKETVSHLKAFLDDPKGMKDPSPTPKKESNFSALSHMETVVAHFLINGETNTQIAERLSIARSNVGTLKQRIFAKTKASNVFELKEMVNNFKQGIGGE